MRPYRVGREVQSGRNFLGDATFSKQPKDLFLPAASRRDWVDITDAITQAARRSGAQVIQRSNQTVEFTGARLIRTSRSICWLTPPPSLAKHSSVATSGEGDVVSRYSVKVASRCHPYSPVSTFRRESARMRRVCPLRCGVAFAAREQVARIQRTRHGETTRVKVSGKLSAADMGRLEHACAPALVCHSLALEIDLRRATSVDRSATAVLGRMAHRGARIIFRESESNT
jgi:hypothetical protein